MKKLQSSNKQKCDFPELIVFFMPHLKNMQFIFLICHITESEMNIKEFKFNKSFSTKDAGIKVNILHNQNYQKDQNLLLHVIHKQSKL